MLRMITMTIASFAVAMVGAAALDGRAAGADWDETAPVNKTLGHEDTPLGDQFFHVECRVTELDAAGQPVESTMREVRGAVPGLGRAYFDVRVPASQAYRAQVASFEFVETSGGG